MQFSHPRKICACEIFLVVIISQKCTTDDSFAADITDPALLEDLFLAHYESDSD